MLRQAYERMIGKVPKGTKRSSQWRSVRREHLLNEPFCMACFGTKKLQVHHIIPFHIAPQLELHHSNLITLCQAVRFGISCHMALGHGGNWRGINADVAWDVERWNEIVMVSRKYAQDHS